MFVTDSSILPNTTPHDFSPSMSLNSNGRRQFFVGLLVTAKTVEPGGTVCKACLSCPELFQQSC